MKRLLISGFMVGLLASGSVLACGGEKSGMHMGDVTNVDKNSFTIKDMESRKPITFAANAEIIKAVKSRGGHIMVNYEEADGGVLKALNVTF